jgi:hypothetical protein
MPATRAILHAAALALGISLLGAAGCASTPEAAPERDAEAKRFVGHPGYAALYIYRPDFPRAEMDDSVLEVDDRLVGATLPGTFFRVDVPPGPHVVRSSASGATELKFDARAGELYFVSLSVLSGNSHLARVGAEAAQREIRRCCALLENWAHPGQRPLLR